MFTDLNGVKLCTKIDILCQHHQASCDRSSKTGRSKLLPQLRTCSLQEKVHVTKSDHVNLKNRWWYKMVARNGMRMMKLVRLPILRPLLLTRETL